MSASEGGMAGLGKLLIVFGVVFVVMGGALVLLASLGGGASWLGRLPGDIHVQRGNWSFYFPLGTSILLSIVLSIVLSLLLRR